MDEVPFRSQRAAPPGVARVVRAARAAVCSLKQCRRHRVRQHTLETHCRDPQNSGGSFAGKLVNVDFLFLRTSLQTGS